MNKEGVTKIDALAHLITEHGFCSVPHSEYLSEESLSDLKTIQASYFALRPDAYGPERLRAFRRLYVLDDEIIFSEKNSYSQSKKYNETDGGIVREFDLIDEKIIKNKLLQSIIFKDKAYAENFSLIDFTKPVVIELHQIRYQSVNKEPSFSSPPHLHKDDEPIVFLHLINLSHNSIGGDTLISRDGRSFSVVTKLEDPLDTICLSKKYYHAVTPLSGRSGGIAYRDILLVTFQNHA